MKKLLFIFGFISLNASAQIVPTIEQCEDLFLKKISINDVDPNIMDIQFKNDEEIVTHHCFTSEYLEPIYFIVTSNIPNFILIVPFEEEKDAKDIFNYYAHKMADYFSNNIIRIKKKWGLFYVGNNVEKNLQVAIKYLDKTFSIIVHTLPKNAFKYKK
ncbi:MAG: hypothetical protein R2779_05515 [Crocinitomicaceae bacterium]|nr:hypothetical protein [Taishania sp.]